MPIQDSTAWPRGNQRKQKKFKRLCITFVLFTHIHTYIYIYIYVYIYKVRKSHIYKQIYLYNNTNIYTDIYSCIDVSTCTFIYRGCPRGVMVKAMDCRIVVREFVLQSLYYIHIRANTLGKGMNPLILPAKG